MKKGSNHPPERLDRRRLLLLGDGPIGSDKPTPQIDNSSSKDSGGTTYGLAQQLMDAADTLGLRPEALTEADSPIGYMLADALSNPISRRNFNAGVASSVAPVNLPLQLPTELPAASSAATGQEWLASKGAKIAQALYDNKRIIEDLEWKVTGFQRTSLALGGVEMKNPSKEPIYETREAVVSHVKGALPSLIKSRITQINSMIDAFTGIQPEDIGEAILAACEAGEKIHDATFGEGSIETLDAGNDLEELGFMDVSVNAPREEWEALSGSLHVPLERFIQNALRDDLIKVAHETYRRTGVVLLDVLPDQVLQDAELHKTWPMARAPRTVTATPEEQQREDELIYGKDYDISQALKEGACVTTRDANNEYYLTTSYKSFQPFLEHTRHAPKNFKGELQALDRLEYIINQRFPDAAKHLEWIDMREASPDLPEHSHDAKRGEMKVIGKMASLDSSDYRNKSRYALKLTIPKDIENHPDLAELQKEMDAVIDKANTKESTRHQRFTRSRAEAIRARRAEDEAQTKGRA